MRALVFHFSSLVGLLVLLNRLTSTAEIEGTVFTAFAAGLVMYTVLMVGFAVARRIKAAMPPADEAGETAASPGATESGSDELIPLNRTEHPTA